MIPGQQSLILEVLLCVLNVGALYNKLHWVQHLPHRYGTPMSNFPIVSQYQVMVSHWIPWCQLIMLAAGQAISVAQPPANTSESPCLCIWKMQKVFILPQRSPGEADPSTSSCRFDVLDSRLAADDTQMYSNVFIFPIVQRIPNVWWQLKRWNHQPIWHFWMIHEAVLTNVSCRSEFMWISWITKKGKPLPWKIRKGHFQGWRLRMLCTITTNYLPGLIRANYSTSDMEFVRSLRCPGIQERNFVTDGIPHIRARDWGIEYVIYI